MRAVSDSFRTFCRLRVPFERPICSEQHLTDVLCSMAADSTAHTDAPLQVFVDGARQASYEASVLQSPPDAGASLGEWLAQTFRAQPYTILMNGLESCSSALASRAAVLADGLYAGGEPFSRTDIEVGAIVGDYEFTPFGVHRDAGGLTIVHLVLGPATKRMFFWEPELFVELTGSERPFHSPHEILDRAKMVELNPGDALAFSGDLYHVGQNQGRVAPLVLLLRRYSREQERTCGFRTASTAVRRASPLTP
jgi:hypothetical protein